MEEVDEERAVSRSGKYSCWKDEEKKITVRNGSTQKAGLKCACEAELLTYHGVRKDRMVLQGPSTLCFFHRPASSTAAAHIKRVHELG